MHEADILESLMNDPQVEIFAFYLESLADGKRFLQAIERISKKKPVIILEPGKTDRASIASSSHTGSLAPDFAVLETAYEQAGAIQTFSMREMFGVLESFAHYPDKKSGNKTVIITNAG